MVDQGVLLALCLTAAGVAPAVRCEAVTMVDYGIAGVESEEECDVCNMHGVYSIVSWLVVAVFIMIGIPVVTLVSILTDCTVWVD